MRLPQRWIISALVTALGQQVNIVGLRGLPGAYAELMSATGDLAGALVRLQGLPSSPGEALTRIDRIATAIGMRYVLWVEDLERFAGGHSNQLGTVETAEEAERLAPIRDDERSRRLTTGDTRGDVRAYAARARSALYDAGSSQPLGLCDAFSRAAASSPAAGKAWLERLQSIPTDAPPTIVARVPGPIMSVPAREFALALLQENRARLENLHVR